MRRSGSREKLYREPSPPPAFVPEPPKVRGPRPFPPPSSHVQYNQDIYVWKYMSKHFQVILVKISVGRLSCYQHIDTSWSFPALEIVKLVPVTFNKQTILNKTPKVSRYRELLFPVTGEGSDSDRLITQLWLTLKQHHQQRCSRRKQAAPPSCGPEANHCPSEPAIRRAEPGEGGPCQQILPGKGSYQHCFCVDGTFGRFSGSSRKLKLFLYFTVWYVNTFLFHLLPLASNLK